MLGSGCFGAFHAFDALPSRVSLLQSVPICVDWLGFAVCFVFGSVSVGVVMVHAFRCRLSHGVVRKCCLSNPCHDLLG